MTRARLLRGAYGRCLALLPARSSYRGEVLGTFVANVAVTGTQALTGILLARLLGPAGRGQLAAIQAFPTAVAAIAMLGVQDALVYLGARSKERIGDYALSATVLILLVSIPITAVAAWIVPRLVGSEPVLVLATRLYLGCTLFFALTTLSIMAARAAHDISLWNRLRLLPNVVWLGVVLVAWLTGRLGPVSIALGYLGLALVAAALAVLPARRYLAGGRVRTALWRPLLRYGLPVFLGTAPRVMSLRLDQVLVAALLSARDLGHYAVAVAWSGLTLLVGAAASSVAFSKVAGMADRHEQATFIRRMLGRLSILTALAAIVLAAITPFAIPRIFGTAFAPAIRIAVILVFATATRNLIEALQVSMMGAGQTSVVMVSDWPGLVVLLAGAALLIPRAGAEGAAWALVAANAVVAAIAFALYRRWLRKATGAG
jgi:O-antigen/teichoic acid export membrane protein